MNRISRKVVLIAAVVIAAAAVSAGFAIAAASGDDDEPLTGSTLDRATAAALQHTGGGTVTETEVGDDCAAYSVEVRLKNGRQVEVNLNESLEVIGQESDDDGAGDNDGPGDDE
jgi:uncharacterized membrane protein YkoI